MNHDPELPAGFQDADFEMRDLERAAARAKARRAAGKCDHGWTGPVDPGAYLAGLPTGVKCLYCGAVFASSDDAWRAGKL